MSGLRSEIMSADVVPLPAQRWPGGAARRSAALHIGLALALLAHVALLLLVLSTRAAAPPDEPAQAMVEWQAATAALPAAERAMQPAAEPAASPAPEPAVAPAPEPARPPAPRELAVRQPPPRQSTHASAHAPTPQAQPAPDATPAEGTQAAPATPAAQPEAGWNERLLGWLERHRVYPEPARRRGEQGEVLVRIDVAADGHVLDQQITQSSGAATLDRAALELLRGATVPAPGTAENRVVRLRYRLSP